MTYRVSKQFIAGGSKEQPISLLFKTVDEATAYAVDHFQSDAAMRIQTIYRVYDFIDDENPIVTIDSKSIDSFNNPSESSQGSQGQQSGATFKPSPLQMAPRPPGTPANHWVDPDKDDKKGK